MLPLLLAAAAEVATDPEDPATATASSTGLAARTMLVSALTSTMEEEEGASSPSLFLTLAGGDISRLVREDTFTCTSKSLQGKIETVTFLR